MHESAFLLFDQKMFFFFQYCKIYLLQEESFFEEELLNCFGEFTISYKKWKTFNHVGSSQKVGTECTSQLLVKKK